MLTPLIFVVIAALIFDYTNGFHDSATVRGLGSDNAPHHPSLATPLIRQLSNQSLTRCFEESRNSFVVDKLSRHADQLGALGHPIRLQIVRYVVKAGSDGAAAGAIQAALDLPASTLSFHLKRLTHARLLTARQASTFLYYSADYAALRDLTDYLWEDCCKGGTKAGCC